MPFSSARTSNPMDKVVSNIERILQNVEDGHCPVSLKAAYLFAR